MGKDILFICDRCNTLVEKGQTRYVLELKLFAGADPVEIDEERHEEFDYNQEIHRLIESMREMDEIYLHDQVYMTRKYHLCTKCRNLVYREVFEDARRRGTTDVEPSPEK